MGWVWNICPEVLIVQANLILLPLTQDVSHEIYSLMLCYQANAGSLSVMANCIEPFSQSSGLTTNSSKSAMYIASDDHSIQLQLAHIVSCSLGDLPFIYLGVPLTSKRLSIRDCDQLVDKITSRNRSCNAKHLLYAACLRLINLVLMGKFYILMPNVCAPKKSNQSHQCNLQILSLV